MSIQWFPGHMAKTRRLLSEQLKMVDAVIELADARMPASSRNPLLQKLLGAKTKLLILNKADLADPNWTEYWLKQLRKENEAMAVSIASGAGVSRIIPQLERLSAEKMN